MKTFLLFISLAVIIPQGLMSQIVEIEGKLKIADDDTSPKEGMIRFNKETKDFEGFTGESWVSLTLPATEMGTFQGIRTYPQRGAIRELFPLGGQIFNNHELGSSVSISNRFAVFGAPLYANGVIYIGEIIDGELEIWNNASIIYPPGLVENALFGFEVAIEGNLIAVSALTERAVYVYEFINDDWVYTTRLLGEDPDYDDGYGRRVEIHNGIIVVGAPFTTVNNLQKSGAIYIHQKNGNSWSTTTKIETPFPQVQAHFGHSIAMDGNRIVVSAPDEFLQLGSFESGVLYVFERTNNEWALENKLNRGVLGLFSLDIDIYRNTIVSSTRQSNNGIVIFEYKNQTWKESGVLKFPDGSYTLGSSIRLLKDVIYIGATTKNYGLGAVYVFKKINDSWSLQHRLGADYGNVGQNFGRSLDANPEFLVVGAPRYIYPGTDLKVGTVFYFK